MKNNPAITAEVCFIGTGSIFSFVALKTLLEHKINISQIILSGHAPATPPKQCLPVSDSGSINHPIDTVQQLAAQLLEQHAIPVTFIGHAKDRQRQWQQWCADEKNHPRPDFVFVACFPEKLPDVVLNWPRHKSINLHPSLLPKYRGPDPVFWQRYNNEKHTGISLHILSDELDAGPIVFQQEIPFPAGANRDELDKLLAQQGAAAFSQLLSNNQFITTEQDATQASYQPAPTKNDRELTGESL